MLRSLAGWTDWMRAAGFTVRLLPGFAACTTALSRTPRVRYRRGASTIRGRRRAVHPVSSGTGGAAAARPARVSNRSLAGHRGVSFLDASAPRADGDNPGRISADHRGAGHALGDDPQPLHGRGSARLCPGAGAPHGIWRAKTIVVAVRAFLRFLGATGQCPPECSTPSPASLPGNSHPFPGFWPRRM